MNYKHLHYFWVVANEGSIARASEVLHLTPQTISGQLSVFEEMMGDQLFSRSGRKLVLTEAGRIAKRYADDIFLLGAELKEALAYGQTNKPLPFKVGVTDGIPKLIAYRLLQPALELEQKVRFLCVEGPLDQLLADMSVHKLDIVLTDGPTYSLAPVKVYNHPLGECGVTFFATHELAQKYRAGFPQSLDDAPMLFPGRGSVARGALQQWFDTLDIRPQIEGDFEDSALMKAFGQAGVGIFTAPSVICNEVKRQYGVEEVGATDEIKERFYAISTERKLKHPAVVAISNVARQRLFIASDDAASPETDS